MAEARNAGPAHDRGMTFPNGGRRHAAVTADELTDSGIHRWALGTQVRLHVYEGYVDCGLLDVTGVTTWAELAQLVTQCRAIEVTGPRRHAFAGGVVLRVECLSDPMPGQP